MVALGWDRRRECHSKRGPVWRAPEPTPQGVDWAKLTWNQAGQCPKPGKCHQEALGCHCLEVPEHQLREV